MPTSRILLVALLLALLPRTQVKAQPFPEAFDHLKKLEQKQRARVTVLLTDLSTQTPIISYRTEDPFCPASLMKIPTTGAFLALRGRDYRFQTPVGIRGVLIGDTLEGQLVIGASGDPSLASHYIDDRLRFIREIAELLHRWGIHRITGGVVLDGRGFPTPTYGEYWPDEDLNEYYGAPASGFNIADNYADVYLRSTGDSLRAETSIASLSLPTAVEVGTGRGMRLDLGISVGGDSLLLSGIARSGMHAHHRRMPLVDPPRFLTSWLREGLKQWGIEVVSTPSPLQVNAQIGISRLGVYSSLKADTLIRITNHRSSNIFAEAFAYHLNDSTQRRASLPISVRNYWRQRLQLSASQFIPYDGSGLSPHGRITAQALSMMLRALWEDETLHAPFLASLPEVGVSGTVRKIQIHPDVRAYMKSGSIRGVRGYAGYIQWGEKWYSLVFMANNLRNSAEAKQSFGRFVSELFVTPPPSTKHKKKANRHAKTSSRKSKRSKRSK
nr:D-alanyl-D-alanine carboxypeptidase/D-alanyl-D-alanine-endopeptidase [uncultured Porphyromonas sp.]